MAVSFENDIRPLFRDGDVKCVKPAGILLDELTWISVPQNAQHVYHAISSGKMSPDAPWPTERVELFKQWMDAGCPT